MAARVVQRVCQQENPGSYLLMHAMGPNVAGVIQISRRRRRHAYPAQLVSGERRYWEYNEERIDGGHPAPVFHETG